MTDIVVATLLLVGCLFTLTGAIGVLRLPDVFARLHAATKTSTLGFSLIALGAGVELADGASTTKLVLAVGCIFVTAPAAAHLVGRVAHRTGTEIGPNTVADELDR
jgi:multicomponent Na+:H+ antiporter subunit G